MGTLRKLLVMILLLVSYMAAGQNGTLLRTPYQPAHARGTVRFYLEDIQRRTQVQIAYSDELLKHRRVIRLKSTEQTIGDVLTTLLSGTDLIATEHSGKILLVPAAADRAAEKPANVTISGIIKDSATREVLIGAAIYIPALNAGTVTNTYGFYSLTIPSGRHDIVVAAAAYRADTTRVSIQSDVRRDILLSYGLSLTGVTVSSGKDGPADHAHLTLKDITQHAGMLGEQDVLRALQYIPGVQAGTDGTSRVLVRGGDPGQNLNLLDGVPLYYIDHFFGLTSIFNTDAVKSVDFYKGAFPARYGGRLSSIIDVASRDGNMKRFGGQASIGLLKGNLMLEGPLVKEKASVMVAARRTWIDALWRPVFDGLALDFYDINAKANWIINKNNRVYVSFYSGRDQFRINFNEVDSRALWGNTIGAARWTAIVNPKLFINTTATYSYFRYQISDQNILAVADSLGRRPIYTGRSEIKDAALRIQADYYLSPQQHIQAGAQYSSAAFLPASATFGNDYSGGFNNTVSATQFRSGETILYGEDELKLSPKWLLRGGLHWASWVSESYHYNSLQPRLFAAWKPDATQQVYGSVTKMSQFLHLLNSNTSGLPSDFWIPGTRKLRPESAWLYALGYSKKAKQGPEWTAELYYKDIRNIVTYKSGSNIFANSSKWDEKLTQGSGFGYGAEVSAREQLGPFTASLAYTLSWAWRQFDLLNSGDPFPYRYDRRHNLKIDLVYSRKRFNAVAGWTFMSGEAITLPDQIYPDFDNNLFGGSTGRTFTYNYSATNNYRLPAIHHLDVACNFIQRRGLHYERTWTLGLFNVYGRKNIFSAELMTEDQGGYSLEGLSLFIFIPTISYSVRF